MKVKIIVACFKFSKKYVDTFCMEEWKNGRMGDEPPDRSGQALPPSFHPCRFPALILPATKNVKRFLKHALFLLIVVFSIHVAIVSAEELLPFRDINDTTEIEIKEEWLAFQSYNGSRIWYRQNGAWKLMVDRSSEAKDLYEHSAHAIDVEYPSWGPKYVYDSIIAHTISGDNEYFLVQHAGEAATRVIESIIDVKRRKVYQIPFQDSRILAVEEPYIWVGYRRGITQIHLETDRRIDFDVLPRFECITGWVDHKGIRYITTAEGDLFAMEIDSGAISQIEIPHELIKGILKEQGQIAFFGDLTPTSTRLHLSNPILQENRLYVGAFPTDFIGRYIEGRSVVFIYDIDSQQWQALNLGEHFGIRKLIAVNEQIWCTGDWQESYEGGDYDEFGGLAVITCTDQLIEFPELYTVPIGGFEVNKDGVWILTAKAVDDLYDAGGIPKRENEPEGFANKNYICEIPFSAMQIKGRVPVSSDSPEVNRFTPLQFSLTSEEQKALSAWRVQMRVVEVFDRAVRVLSSEHFQELKN